MAKLTDKERKMILAELTMARPFVPAPANITPLSEQFSESSMKAAMKFGSRLRKRTQKTRKTFSPLWRCKKALHAT